MTRARAVRHSQVELRFHRRGRHCHGAFELFYRLVGVGRCESGSEVGARIGVVRTEPDRLTKRRNARLVVPRLDQHETEIVMCLGKIGLQANRFPELRDDLAARRPLATEQQAEHVVGDGMSGAGPQCLTNPCNRCVPIWHRKGGFGQIQARLELSERLFEIVSSKKRHAQIDVDRSGRRQHRDRTLQGRTRRREITPVSQHRTEKRI
jgi:hypothetical protein